MSEKPVAERLQVKNGRTLALVAAPKGLVVEAATAPTAKADVVLAFTPDRKALDKTLAKLPPTLKDGAILWVAYPKLTSTLAVDLSRDLIREVALGAGLDTVAQIAIDADWSALRLKPTSPQP
ncbi:DUF3052 family protein [Luteibacter pinisoli]|nr:DUF3052 family protein [Luteibacter pinisoli]